jgi:hypothetical protein
MTIYLILFFAICLNATANILLKVGMNRSGSFSFTNIPEIISKVVFNPIIIGG